MGSILSQPAEFQVANYNIHPPPTVSLDKPFEHNETIYAYLMEASTGLVISKGNLPQSSFLRYFPANFHVNDFRSKKYIRLSKWRFSRYSREEQDSILQWTEVK